MRADGVKEDSGARLPACKLALYCDATYSFMENKSCPIVRYVVPVGGRHVGLLFSFFLGHVFLMTDIIYSG